jgi:hypothetical protein
MVMMTDYSFPKEVTTLEFHEEVTAIYAGRSSGKTTLAQKLIRENKPRQMVWIDPTQPANTSISDLQKMLRAGERSIMFGVSDPDMALAALMYCYGECTKAKRIYVVCDEAKAYLNKKRDDIATVVNQGRHAGLGMLILTQRPSAVHPDYRSQASKTYWGKLSESDAAIAAGIIGRDKSKALPNAKVGQFIESEN